MRNGSSRRRSYCARRGLRFRGLHLPASDGDVALDGFLSFGGSKFRLSFALALRLALRRRRTALFFDHAGPARALVPSAGRQTLRYAVQLHGIEVWRPLSNRHSRALAGAAVLVANSEFTATKARPFLPPNAAIRVVPPGIEPRRQGGAPDADLLARAEHGFALIAARISDRERYKGHDELLSALALLAPTVPTVRLVVAGEGADRARLEGAAAELGLSDRVLFTGAISDATLEELYRRAALFVMPSKLEGFGLVFVEAMAAAKPCIALAGTAPAEIVVDGETGLLVSPDDPRALAGAIGELLSSPERARAMGIAGRRRYEAEFTAEAFDARFEMVLEELIGAQHSSRSDVSPAARRA